MPIEIRELVIKATIQQDAPGISVSGLGDNNSVKPAEEIIKASIEKINESTRERNER